jgi:hypothetical protein
MEIINKDAMERFIGYGIIRTSNANKNGKVKMDLADIFTKGTQYQHLPTLEPTGTVTVG